MNSVTALLPGPRRTNSLGTHRVGDWICSNFWFWYAGEDYNPNRLIKNTATFLQSSTSYPSHYTDLAVRLSSFLVLAHNSQSECSSAGFRVTISKHFRIDMQPQFFIPQRCFSFVIWRGSALISERNYQCEHSLIPTHSWTFSSSGYGE
jgi:hypothetical protein